MNPSERTKLPMLVLLIIGISVTVCGAKESKLKCLKNISNDIKKTIFNGCESSSSPNTDAVAFWNGVMEYFVDKTKQDLEKCGFGKDAIEEFEAAMTNTFKGTPKEMFQKDEASACLKDIEENIPNEPGKCCDYLQRCFKCFGEEFEAMKERNKEEWKKCKGARDIIQMEKQVTPQCTI